MKLTEKQREAVRLAASGQVDHLLLYGGARSGKTAGALDLLLYRASRFPGSRHLAARLRFNHAKVSLWLDSIPRALARRGIPEDAYEVNNSDYFIRFRNGSEIWLDGLDSADRIEKILGREYATVYLNEISQISYEAATTARTRLSQAIKGMHCYTLYDCNPPSTRHWSYSLWFKGIDPESGEALKNPGAYRAVLMNPYDNAENLPEGYIERELENLPEAKRRRFLLGQYADGVEGLIFRRASGRPPVAGEWDVIEEIPHRVIEKARRAYGLDYGYTVDPAAAVLCLLDGDDLYIDELFYATGMTNAAIEAVLRSEGTPYHDGYGREQVLKLGTSKLRPDPAEPKSNDYLRGRGFRIPDDKGKLPVQLGLDWLLDKRLHVTKRSANIQNELDEYRWLTNKGGRMMPEPIDEFNHAIDAVRYACKEWIGGSSGARSIL